MLGQEWVTLTREWPQRGRPGGPPAPPVPCKLRSASFRQFPTPHLLAPPRRASLPPQKNRSGTTRWTSPRPTCWCRSRATRGRGARRRSASAVSCARRSSAWARRKPRSLMRSSTRSCPTTPRRVGVGRMRALMCGGCGWGWVGGRARAWVEGTSPCSSTAGSLQIAGHGSEGQIPSLRGGAPCV